MPVLPSCTFNVPPFAIILVPIDDTSILPSESAFVVTSNLPLVSLMALSVIFVSEPIATVVYEIELSGFVVSIAFISTIPLPSVFLPIF